MFMWNRAAWGKAEMADIVARAKALLTQPDQEWPAIAAEPADTKGLILGYAAILSLIPVVIGLIVPLLLGGMMPMRFGFGTLLLHAVVQYGLGLGSVWVVGKIIQTLAPMFGGVSDEVSAMKLSVYPPTASWVASILVLIPIVGWLLALAGVAYSIYLFYLGASVVAKVPADKAIPFTVAVAICAIVLAVVVGLIATRLLFWY